MDENKMVIHWFRRDLRLDDNVALYHALKSGRNVLCIFIFDRNILSSLSDKHDARVNFIHNQLLLLQTDLADRNSGIKVLFDKPLNAWKKLITEFNIEAVYINEDYEPYAKKRDLEIESLLKANGVAFHAYKDQVIFAPYEVLKDDHTPYTVFTPYSKKWLKKLEENTLFIHDIDSTQGQFYDGLNREIPSLAEIGFLKSEILFPEVRLDNDTISNYDERRNFPAILGTTHVSTHLRFGTMSIRRLVMKAMALNHRWLLELCWREFFMMILYHFPHTVTRSFKPAYDHIKWENNPEFFERWKNGTTGFPIVDAGMRELNQTGFMHNRLRMITSSFLTKDLLIDWRWGEAYFAAKLLDFELSSNVGGWQWAAGSGCDAAPYFRIFNPTEQTKRFDPDLVYIRKWVPEFQDFSYPRPLVDHAKARTRCLEVYTNALKKS